MTTRIIAGKVYGVWSEEDYYGPHLVELCATQEVAKQVQAILNAPYRARCRVAGVVDAEIPQDWPHIIHEHALTVALGDEDDLITITLTRAAWAAVLTHAEAGLEQVRRELRTA